MWRISRKREWQRYETHLKISLLINDNCVACHTVNSNDIFGFYGTHSKPFKMYWVKPHFIYRSYNDAVAVLSDCSSYEIVNWSKIVSAGYISEGWLLLNTRTVEGRNPNNCVPSSATPLRSLAGDNWGQSVTAQSLRGDFTWRAYNQFLTKSVIILELKTEQELKHLGPQAADTVLENRGGRRMARRSPMV